jgi:hypothetical protein
MEKYNKNTVNGILLLLFAISFFAARIPLLNEPLGFEEGIFAELIVNRPAGPHYALSGRIDGQKTYTYISHPATLYELLKLGGYISKEFLTYDIYLNDSLITPRLRLICSFYQFIFWAILLIFALISQSIHGKWPILIIFTAMLSPLALKTSTFLQIDNTSGMLLCGLAALLFSVANQKNMSPKKSTLFLFAGGFIVGLGKQEWSFALLAAMAVMFFLTIIAKRKSSDYNYIKIISCIATGILLGNIVSFLYDPVNYTRGLHYIAVFFKLQNSSPSHWDFTHWLMLTKKRLPFIYVCFILLLPTLYNLFFKRDRQLLSYLTSLYGFFLLVGYIVADHNYHPRYFCPSLAVLTISAITLTPSVSPKWFNKTLTWALLSVFLSTAIFIICYAPDRNLELEKINSGLLKSPSGTVLYLNDGAGWNKPEIDYKNNNSAYKLARQRIAEKYNKDLIKPSDYKDTNQCKPDDIQAN